jgi:mono/diheme cytochrome c family protein
VIGKRLVLVALLVLGCRAQPPFTQPLQLGGGKSIPPDVLNDGREAYTLYCQACHGEKGDGQGPSAPGMRPPPRNFTEGMFKFGGVPSGQLPTDEDLIALVKNGLDGTPMLPWDITDRERYAIVQYIKTFSDVWKKDPPGERVAPDAPDPWAGKEAEAIELGKQIYHLVGAQMENGQPKHVFAGCIGCHPAYLPRAELTALSQKVLGTPAQIRDNPYRPDPKPAQYKVGDHELSIPPIDFLFHRVKNGTGVEALYRTIAAGVGGTAMPFWKQAIKDPDMWALAHYVKSLVDVRGTPAAMALEARLAAGQ